MLDFEITGLSPAQGDRAIKIGAVMLENGRITDRYQKLMNPGFRINLFIGGHNLVAHNASFDKKFLDAELEMAGSGYRGSSACSMLLARRLYQNAPNHQLSCVPFSMMKNYLEYLKTRCVNF